MPLRLRRECHAAVEVGGSWMELRESCDLNQATSSRVGELGSVGLVTTAVAVDVGQKGKTEKVWEDGEKEGSRRKRRKAAAARRKRNGDALGGRGRHRIE